MEASKPIIATIVHSCVLNRRKLGLLRCLVLLSSIFGCPVLLCVRFCAFSLPSGATVALVLRALHYLKQQLSGIISTGFWIKFGVGPQLLWLVKIS